MSYDQAYENSLHFSPRFREYAQTLATNLINRYNLYDKDVIEIGCGDGDFLNLLCEQGPNRGVGFDPSFVPERNGHHLHENVKVVRDFYSEKYSAHRADFISCRHVLEHIQFPRDFLANVSKASGNHQGTVIFFEVPNVAYTLKDLGIWDLIYEHRSYFSKKSLVHIFESCGYTVHHCAETFDEQFLGIEASPAGKSASAPKYSSNGFKSLSGNADAFAEEYRNKVHTWQSAIKKAAQEKQRVVIWGAGSKGVTFMNALGISKEIEYVVDINHRKHDHFVAGTGQTIVPPSFLSEYQPDLVIVMNAIYLDEIKNTIREMNLSAKVVSTD